MKNVLITGGTGRLGTAITEYLKSQDHPGRIATLSRSLDKQAELLARFPDVECFTGDVADREAICRAMDGCDTVIHCAAMKDPSLCEIDTTGCVDANIHGTMNLIDAAKEVGVSKVIYISTDMAVEPESMYGASKMVSDLLVTAAARDGLCSAVVRIGNIIGARGSVFSLFKQKLREHGYIPVTDSRMSRFILSVEQCAAYVVHVVEMCRGGETFVPKCQCYDIMRLVEAIGENTPVKIVGMRPGDMLVVKMLSQGEAWRSVENDQEYIILPRWYTPQQVEQYRVQGALDDKVSDGFSLTSANNPRRATVEELRAVFDRVK